MESDVSDRMCCFHLVRAQSSELQEGYHGVESDLYPTPCAMNEFVKI